MPASKWATDKHQPMKNKETCEYYVSPSDETHKAGLPCGPDYEKMIEDLGKLRAAIAEWQPAQKSDESDGQPLLNQFEVLEQLGRIEAGVACWQSAEQETIELEAQLACEHRESEWKAVQENLSLAGRGSMLAKSVLVGNQDALWAALFILHANREKSAVHLLEECSDSVTPIPPVLGKCFAQLGLSDDTSIRKAMKPA
jgi:hypothetical protein